jgi:hypothetical protein
VRVSEARWERRSQTYNEHDFKCQPCAICDHPFPADVIESDGVHERREKSRRAAKELEDGYTFGALREGEKLDEICCGYTS